MLLVAIDFQTSKYEPNKVRRKPVPIDFVDFLNKYPWAHQVTLSSN